MAVGLALLFALQDQKSEDIRIITSRLDELDVPLKSVQYAQKGQNQLEIILQSQSNNEAATQEDLWYRHLAYREAELMHLNGHRIDGYRLILVNQKDEIISSETIFLNEDMPSQTLQPARKPSMDEDSVRKLIMEKFNIYDLQIMSLSVQTGGVVRSNTRCVQFDLSVSTVERLNQIVDPLILSVRPLIENINNEHGAQISLLRLRIYADGEHLLVEYIYDFDLRSEVWSLAKGVEADWFPKPAPEKRSTPEIPPPTPTPLVEPTPIFRSPLPPPT